MYWRGCRVNLIAYTRLLEIYSFVLCRKINTSQTFCVIFVVDNHFIVYFPWTIDVSFYIFVVENDVWLCHICILLM